MAHRGERWFRFALAAGFVLGLVLLAEGVLTYRYVADDLVVDHLKGEAGRLVSLLEARAREGDASTPDALSRMIEDLRWEQGGRVAWIRIAGQTGEILSGSAAAPSAPVSEAALRSLLVERVQNVHQVLGSRMGMPVLVVVCSPFRFQFADERSGGRRTDAPGRPRFKIAEVALTPHVGPRDPFRPLVRNLVVGTSASVALLASMVVLAAQLRVYLRSRKLEEQLAVARAVQQGLLPAELPRRDRLDLAAVCLPAWQVGGDYYDVFPVGERRMAVVLGDVSGKGLPAALIASVLHGAVRTASGAWPGVDLRRLTASLNELLLTRTAENRFVSLFWSFYDIETGHLAYVNAGHLPGLVLRHDRGEVEHLERGGPVLGLLPAAPYDEGEAFLGPGDLLVLYSDGIVEAANAAEEMFGMARIEAFLLSARERPAADVVRGLLAEVRKVAGSGPLADDATVLVVRAGPGGRAATRPLVK